MRRVCAAFNFAACADKWQRVLVAEGKIVGNARTIEFARIAKGAALVLSLLASAYVTAFAIGSTGNPWLGWIILPPLFFAIRFLAPRLAMACGALWGLSVFLFSVCVVETAVPATGLSLALLALIPAGYAYLCARVTCGLGFCALLLGFGWIGVELGLRPPGRSPEPFSATVVVAHGDEPARFPQGDHIENGQ